VGIGTSSPAKQLDLAASNTGITTGDPLNTLRFTDTDTTSAAGQPMGRIEWYSDDSDGAGVKAYIQAQATDGSPDGDMIFATNHVSGGGTAERMRIQYDGNVGIGTSSPATTLHIRGSVCNFRLEDSDTSAYANVGVDNSGSMYLQADPGNSQASTDIYFATDGTERARIDSDGNLVVGSTITPSGLVTTTTTTGVGFSSSGFGVFTRSGIPLYVNRLTSDGTLVELKQAGTIEGTISVSGTTVSYNGGHLSRWAQTTTAKDESLVKGTVLSNLDEMNVYTDADGNPVENEQLNKVKVSDVEGDANVAGVFVNWDHDEAHNVDEINMAMTGDMIIRIAQGVTVQRGDLLMSAGDGTAKPQGDDIVRSKTVAKVTSTHVTCTYADGSFCVPCVLMAC
jgi:hypothetical protein